MGKRIPTVTTGPPRSCSICIARLTPSYQRLFDHPPPHDGTPCLSLAFLHCISCSFTVRIDELQLPSRTKPTGSDLQALDKARCNTGERTFRI
jgi:hypothetical protein